MHWLDPVRDALDAAPRPITVFFRDDDVGWRADRLRALLDLFAEHALPVDLAVIPAALDESLAAELAGTDVGLHQHGFAHLNHEPEGRKHEFGPSRSHDVQRRDIEAGAARLRRLLDGRIDPIFTPPWNRCTPETGRTLVELGFQALSREARAEPLNVPGLREVPVHIDWFARRRGTRLTPERLGARIAEALQDDGPTGVMFHHAGMDQAERDRAAELLTLLAGHDKVEPEPMMAVVAAGPV